MLSSPLRQLSLEQWQHVLSHSLFSRRAKIHRNSSKYLGTVLPICSNRASRYLCLKDVPASSTHGLPEAIAIVFIVLLHKWKKSTLLSIGGGTVLYMVLIQTVFAEFLCPNKKTRYRSNILCPVDTEFCIYSAISLIASTVLLY